MNVNIKLSVNLALNENEVTKTNVNSKTNLSMHKKVDYEKKQDEYEFGNEPSYEPEILKREAFELPYLLLKQRITDWFIKR